MQTPKAVIFDCDGVMFNTAKANTAYYNQILQAFGKPELTREQFEKAQMFTADQSIDYLFPDPKEREQAREYRKQMTYMDFIPLMEMENDLVSLLEDIRPGFLTAIVTNRSDTMDRVLDAFHLKNYFDKVVTSLDVFQPKPSPDPLNKAISYFGIFPGQAIYIGDSSVDETASQRAGVPFVAFRNPDLHARYHINNLTEIKSILGMT